MARTLTSPSMVQVGLALHPPVRDRWDALASETGKTRVGFLRLAVELADALLHGHDDVVAVLIAQLDPKEEGRSVSPADRPPKSSVSALQNPSNKEVSIP